MGEAWYLLVTRGACAGSDLGINWFCVVQFALGELYNAKQCISAIRGFSG